MSIGERDSVAIQFGVSPEQVERDYLISHLLAAVSRGFGDRLHFIGGTALARTHLVSGRLSEDIDLVALDNRTVLAAELDAALPRSVARSYGRLEWSPSLSDVSDTGWRAPGEDDWNTQLAGQTRLVITAETALAAVRDAWARVAE
ncbi:nucleotidyl transferase AbiEii/AbiGii toxin family protein [Nocardia sp. CA-135398]|uniref:nucleotidyl transferase AbiEii/AbiGii toxin family protein n=1 Tax=Nocardia sp. CA-135398 TaxID=3239977 RepID=UPI003D967D69